MVFARQGNTRTKTGQVPRLLVNISYKPGHEFQFGNLLDYVETQGDGDERNWKGPQDYRLDLSKLRERLEGFSHHIERVSYCLSPDINLSEDDQTFLSNHHNLDFDGTKLSPLSFSTTGDASGIFCAPRRAPVR